MHNRKAKYYQVLPETSQIYAGPFPLQEDIATGQYLKIATATRSTLAKLKRVVKCIATKSN